MLLGRLVSIAMAASIHVRSPIGVDKLLAKQLEQDFPETTVLVRAVRAGTVQETKFLLERGCNPNIPCGVHRIRPLMFACHLPNIKKRTRILKLLLEHGANPTLKDMHGRSSLVYACAFCVHECVHSMLLNHDFDLSDIDQEGNTLLHICAMTGDHSNLTRVLQDAMKLKIEISLRNDYSLTPLSVAVLRSNWMCVDVLHNIGATPRLPLCDESNVMECVKEPSALNNIMHTVLKDMKANALCALASERDYGVPLSRSTPSTPVAGEWVTNVRFGLTQRRSLSAHARLLPTRSRSRAVPHFRQTSTYHFNKTVQDVEVLPHIQSNRPRGCLSSHDVLSVLAHLSTVQKTSLFCKPHPKAKIDQQWIEVIQKYSECESTDGDESSEDAIRPVLTRTVSSPHGIKNNLSARPRKLVRYTTSPQFDLSSLNFRQNPKTVA